MSIVDIDVASTRHYLEPGFMHGFPESNTSAFLRHYEGIRAASRCVVAERHAAGNDPEISFLAPELTSELIRYFDVDVTMSELDPGPAGSLWFMDLMQDPFTRTTKSLASMLMVARAAEHARQTNERIVIVTPSSGNKATALRAAVKRAHECGLADESDLSIVVMVPESSRSKLRHVSLDPRRNPSAVADVENPGDVKQICASAVDALRGDLLSGAGVRLWNSLDIDNYRIADSVRAFVEAETHPITTGSSRYHAHAVSSAFGLLGYSLGHSVLQTGQYSIAPRPAYHPGFFLIQQMATPDMVASLMRNVEGVGDAPNWVENPGGTWSQTESLNFPPRVSSLNEVIDHTFYTSAPPTSVQVNSIVSKNGGNGIVVSKLECASHYSQVAELLRPVGIELPNNMSAVREWSLVKAFTGVLLGIERGLIPSDTDLVVHGSGHYTDDLVPPADPLSLQDASSVEQFASLIRTAALG